MDFIKIKKQAQLISSRIRERAREEINMKKLLMIGAGLTSFACNNEKVIVANRLPPEVVIQEPSNGSNFYVGQLITFKAFVQVDSNVDVSEFTHQWSTGNQTVCQPENFDTDGFGFCEWTYESIGAYTMTLSVNGNASGAAQTSIDVNVLHNEAPTILITQPEMDELFASDDMIVFTAEVTDPEESSEHLTVSGFSNIDGDLGFQMSPVSSGEFSEGVFLSSGQHLITMTVEDSYGRTDMATVEMEVYDNGPPVVDVVSIDPSAPDTTQDLMAVIFGWGVQDGEIENYRYRWFVADEDGLMEQEVNEVTDSFPSARTIKGDLIQVEVTPYNDFGDGPSLLSTVVEVENSVPTQPTVSITPTFPQPTDHLSCATGGVTDADNDNISYEYAWYQNGTLLAGETSSVLNAGFTAHGDVYSCEIRAHDGEDYSTPGSASVTVLDTEPPDAPVINSPGTFLNDTDVTLEGICEPDCSMVMYCADGVINWADNLTCSSSGTFSYVTTFNRGFTTECYATCQDVSGNISPTSASVSAEVCTPADTYEATGLGDASSSPINQWSSILDDGSMINIFGNVLEDDVDDWYIITAADDVSEDLAYGIDYYRFDVEITTGASDYAMVVYKGGTSVNEVECNNSIYTEYSDFNQDIGDGVWDNGSPRAIPSDTRACGSNSSSYNDCADNSTDYYIHVFRTTAVSSCQNYQLTITNGVW